MWAISQWRKCRYVWLQLFWARMINNQEIIDASVLPLPELLVAILCFLCMFQRVVIDAFNKWFALTGYFCLHNFSLNLPYQKSLNVRRVHTPRRRNAFYSGDWRCDRRCDRNPMDTEVGNTWIPTRSSEAPSHEIVCWNRPQCFLTACKLGFRGLAVYTVQGFSGCGYSWLFGHEFWSFFKVWYEHSMLPEDCFEVKTVEDLERFSLIHWLSRSWECAMKLACPSYLSRSHTLSPECWKASEGLVRCQRWDRMRPKTLINIRTLLGNS